MNSFIFNGKILKPETCVISADNRGFRYGDGLFETMKFKHGELIFGNEHFARLWKGMNTLKFDIPKHFVPALLEEQIRSLLKKNHKAGMARIRLTVFRGDGGLYDASGQLNYVIQAWDLPENADEWNSNGITLGIYHEIKKSCDILSNIKHNNFLPYALAAIHSRNEKWNDAILLNTNGRICDTTVANIFIIKDNIFYTPSLDEGCIAGIIRKYLINRLQSLHYTIQEKALTSDDLINADEVFLSNSIFNIRWVGQLGDIIFSNKTLFSIYPQLIQSI